MSNSENLSNEQSDSKSSDYQNYPYRWIVLIIFMFVGAMTQVIWITFAGVTTESATYYSVNENLILLLSVVFMVAYIPVNFLACWLIDKFGLKWGTGIGVILTGVFGFLRAFAPNYWWLLTFQIMTAIGQPFVLNSFTKLAANWFPDKERTLASGLATLALLLGVIIAFITSPFLLGDSTPYKMSRMLFVFGGAALLSTILYLIFVKDKPPTPVNAYSDKSKVLQTEGMFSLFKKKDFTYLFLILFIGLGAFNAISTVLDVVFDYPEGSEIPGLIGGVMTIGGIIGAIVVSTLSDKFQKRKIFIIIAMISGAVLTPILIFIPNDIVRFIIGFIYGFTLVSALPVGLTFAAEITHPMPEETSNGFMQWAGQISGILFLLGIMLANQYNESLMYINIIIITVMFVGGVVCSFLMKDLEDYNL